MKIKTYVPLLLVQLYSVPYIAPCILLASKYIPNYKICSSYASNMPLFSSMRYIVDPLNRK